MDKATYLKLFAPIDRYTAKQSSIPDCWFVSVLNQVMQNPKTRVGLYQMFQQQGNDITVTLKNAKYKEVKDNLTLELVKRYYGLQLAKEVSAVRMQNMKDVEQHLKDAKALESSG